MTFSDPPRRLKASASSASLCSGDSDASTTSTATEVSSRSSIARGPNGDIPVVLLEWHWESRPHDYHLTSHSWLEMQLADGAVWRLEFSSDRGFSETIEYAPSSVESVYERRVTADFKETLTSASLRRACYHAACRKRYSTVHFNCHHWALAVWNELVRERSQHRTYPDQWKAALASLLGLSTFLEPACGQVTGTAGSVRPNLTKGLARLLPSIA